METFEILNIIGPIGNKMFFKQQKQHLYYLYYCFWQTEKKNKLRNSKIINNLKTALHHWFVFKKVALEISRQTSLKKCLNTLACFQPRDFVVKSFYYFIKCNSTLSLDFKNQIHACVRAITVCIKHSSGKRKKPAG